MPKNSQIIITKIKPMSEAKKRKLQKHGDWLMSKGVKDKGRNSKPAVTNKYGRIIQSSPRK